MTQTEASPEPVASAGCVQRRQRQLDEDQQRWGRALWEIGAPWLEIGDAEAVADAAVALAALERFRPGAAACEEDVLAEAREVRALEQRACDALDDLGFGPADRSALLRRSTQRFPAA